MFCEEDNGGNVGFLTCRQNIWLNEPYFIEAERPHYGTPLYAVNSCVAARGEKARA